MANQQNETLIHRMLDLMDQPQLPSDYEQLFDPNYENHSGAQFSDGPQGYKALYNFWHGSFSDLHTTVQQLFSEGDFVAAHWHLHGTHAGEFLGTPPTGKQIDIRITGLWRCHNGKIAEAWVTPDRLALYEQIGIVKTPDMSQRRAA